MSLTRWAWAYAPIERLLSFYILTLEYKIINLHECIKDLVQKQDPRSVLYINN